jgi:hypothetical protein
LVKKCICHLLAWLSFFFTYLLQINNFNSHFLLLSFSCLRREHYPIYELPCFYGWIKLFSVQCSVKQVLWVASLNTIIPLQLSSKGVVAKMLFVCLIACWLSPIVCWNAFRVLQFNPVLILKYIDVIFSSITSDLFSEML